MDFGSLVGMLSGIGLIIGAILIGGDMSDFINYPGMMIVVGGTLAATLINFQFKDVRAAISAAWLVITNRREDPNQMVSTMVNLCKLTRKKGFVALQNTGTKNPFLRRVCSLIADSSNEDVIRATLRIEIESMKMRHHIVQDVYRKMGMFAPSFGMLGTLVGLVQMLVNLEDPSSIGPSMAVALLTTFYGSLLSALVFLPIAGKLRSRTLIQVINLEIMFEGGISILQNNNPMMVYEKLSSFIPLNARKPMGKALAEGKDGSDGKKTEPKAAKNG